MLNQEYVDMYMKVRLYYLRGFSTDYKKIIFFIFLFIYLAVRLRMNTLDSQ